MCFERSIVSHDYSVKRCENENEETQMSVKYQLQRLELMLTN